MKMRFLFGFLISLPLLLPAQVDKSNYSLLWEISGNGLTKPSYLFGTMHVRDIRAFEFSDSVLIALENSEALALELQPDSLVKLMFDLTIFGDTTNTLKDWMSPEAYDRLNEAIKEKTGQSIEEMDVKDPMWIEQLFADFEEPEATPKMDQFVDLYLYKIAYLSQKPILGLEKLSDYDNVTRSFFEMFENPAIDLNGEPPADDHFWFDQMLNLYREGDLKKIEAFVGANSVDADYDFEMLDRRNMTMAGRLETIAQKQSTFFAVGTAHLPGENGMLHLLEQKGYQVRKVMPTFTGLAQNYKAKGSGPAWHTSDQPEKGYRFQTPGEPFDVVPPNIEITGLMDGMLYFDMIDMNGYIISAVSLPEPLTKEKDYDEMITGFLEEWQEGAPLDIIKSKKLKRKGYYGKAITLRNLDGGYMQWQTFGNSKFLYLFGVYREDDRFNTPRIEHFFSSIELYPAEAMSWNIFRNQEGAFSAWFPGQPVYYRSEQPFELEGSSYTMVINSYVGNAPETFSNYLVRYNDYPGSTTIFNDQIILSANLEQFYPKFGDPISLDSTLLVNGQAGRGAVFSFEGMRVEIRIFLKGRRVYYVLAQNPEGSPIDEAQRFFESFHILPTTYSALNPTKITEGSFQVGFPNTYWQDSLAESQIEFPHHSERRYYSTDTIAGVLYLVIRYEFSPYFEVEDWSEYNEGMQNELAIQENLVYVQDTTFLGGPAWQLSFSQPNTRSTNYNLIFFSGQTMYEMIAYLSGPGQEDQAWQFFNTFQPEGTVTDPADYFTRSKTDKLFAAFQTMDSLTLARAKEAIDYVPMDATHLPLIYQTLEMDIPIDTVGQPSVHNLLLNTLTIVHDDSTIPFLRKLYQADGSSPQLRELIMAYLPDFATAESMDAFFEIARNYPSDTLEIINSYNIYTVFFDSLELTRQYLPELMTIYPNELFQWGLYQLLTQWVEHEDGLDPKLVSNHLGIILEDLEKKLDEYLWYEAAGDGTAYENYWDIAEILKLLLVLPSDSRINQSLLKAQTIKEPYLLGSIQSVLIKNDQVINPAGLDLVFAHPGDWYYLLDRVNQYDRLEKLPKEMRTQEVAVRAYASAYLESEYGKVTAFDYIEERPYTYQEKPVKLYLFTFTIEGTEGTFLGIASQPNDIEQIEIDPTIFDYSGTEYVPEQKEAILEGILEYWE